MKLFNNFVPEEKQWKMQGSMMKNFRVCLLDYFPIKAKGRYHTFLSTLDVFGLQDTGLTMKNTNLTNLFTIGPN